MRDIGVEGRVVIGFVVNDDGSLSDFTVQRSICRDLDSEAMRVARLLPSFHPAMLMDKPIKFNYLLPFKFKLTPGADSSHRSSAKVSSVADTLNSKIFTVVEQMPSYPGGEQAMQHFISKNLKYPDYEAMHRISGRVIIGFVVNEDGHISDIKVRNSVSKGLDEEACRVINLFPAFKPGKQQGRPVKVSYVLPILFKLSDSAPDQTAGYIVPDKEARMPGGDEAMMRFIADKVVYPDRAWADKIQGKVIVGFRVDAKGHLSDFAIKSGVRDDINAEALRVAKLLPDFKPAIYKGQAVPTQYSLPIVFRLNRDRGVAIMMR